MAKSIIKLPTIINESCWFFEENKEVLKDFIGMPYISYSSVNAWNDPKYQPDFIKQKFGGIKLPDGIYAEFGSFVGEAIENGKFGDNPNNFQGLENLNLELLRPPNSEYERFIIIPFGSFVMIGFIDRFTTKEDSVEVTDFKTGGKNKEDDYKSPKYRQTTLYAWAEELKGTKSIETGVYFIRREGTHANLPMTISQEQFYIPLDYTPEKAQEALEYVEKTVEEISDVYKTYLKVFGGK